MSRLRSDGCVCDADDVEAIALIDDDVAGVPAVSSDSDDDKSVCKNPSLVYWNIINLKVFKYIRISRIPQRK